MSMMAGSVGMSMDGGSDLDMGLLDGLEGTLSHSFGITSRTLRGVWCVVRGVWCVRRVCRWCVRA